VSAAVRSSTGQGVSSIQSMGDVPAGGVSSRTHTVVTVGAVTGSARRCGGGRSVTRARRSVTIAVREGASSCRGTVTVHGPRTGCAATAAPKDPLGSPNRRSQAARTRTSRPVSVAWRNTSKMSPSRSATRMMRVVGGTSAVAASIISNPRRLSADQVRIAQQLMAGPDMTGAQVAAALHVSRATLYRALTSKESRRWPAVR
jgi:hypothetical protein